MESTNNPRDQHPTHTKGFNKHIDTVIEIMEEIAT